MSEIEDALSSTCETSPILGALQLAYDLAYQSARTTGSLVYMEGKTDIPLLAELSRETGLLEVLEKTNHCGGVCAIRPQVFTTGEMPQNSCKYPLIDLLQKGQKLTLGLLISALLAKTVALILLYLLVFRKKRSSDLMSLPFPIFPPVIPNEHPREPKKPSMDVSFAQPSTPPNPDAAFSPLSVTAYRMHELRHIDSPPAFHIDRPNDPLCVSSSSGESEVIEESEKEDS